MKKKIIFKFEENLRLKHTKDEREKKKLGIIIQSNGDTKCEVTRMREQQYIRIYM